MVDIVMPKFGLTMTEGLITAWNKQPGDTVRRGDILLEVETEKVTTEVEATADGILMSILHPEGSVVAVGLPIAQVDGGAMSAPEATLNPTAAALGSAKDAPSARKLMAEHSFRRDDIAGSCRDGRVMKEDVLRVIATPLARRAAKTKGIDLGTLKGSGPGGRIRAADVEGAAVIAPAPTGFSEAHDENNLLPTPPDAARAATARHVQAAKRDIPHFYLTRHVNVAALNQLRTALNAKAGDRTRISVTHLLVKATALALSAHPALNRIWLPEGIRSLPGIGVGIVTETPQGLRIPVAHRADLLPLDTLATHCAALFSRARSGHLTAADVSGGAISISNVGIFGADTLTPIISPPQAMILGVGAEQRLFRPDDYGQPIACTEIILTLAADHRLIDGAAAARFLTTLTQMLEHPFELLRAPASHAAPTGP